MNAGGDSLGQRLRPVIVEAVDLHDGVEALQQAEVVALDLVLAVQLSLALLQLERHMRAGGRRAVVDGW